MKCCIIMLCMIYPLSLAAVNPLTTLWQRFWPTRYQSLQSEQIGYRIEASLYNTTTQIKVSEDIDEYALKSNGCFERNASPAQNPNGRHRITIGAVTLDTENKKAVVNYNIRNGYYTMPSSESTTIPFGQSQTIKFPSPELYAVITVSKITG